MRRPPQDRGATQRPVSLLRQGTLSGLAAPALVLALVFVIAAPAAAQRGCAGKPGGTDKAALLQYCPSHARPSDGSAGASGTGLSGSEAAAAPLPDPKLASETPRSDEAELPFSDYPSTGGINVLVLLLAALVLALGAAYGVRRWRRSHPRPS